MRFNKKVIYTKIEGTYGTDPVPVAATDAMLCAQVRITPVKLDQKARNLVLPYFGNQGKLIAGQYALIELDFEMSASGVAGTPPAYAVQFKGCGMAETINAAVSAVYTPVSGGENSVTHYLYIDGLLHKFLGAKGDVSWNLKRGDTPMWTFKFFALYTGPTDTAITVPTVTAFTAPLEVNKANTVASLHGYAAIFADMAGSLGNKIAYRNLPGVEEIVFQDRSATGSFVIQMPTVAQKDYFTIAKNATLGAFTVTHGTTAGSKVKIDHSNVQVANQEPNYQEMDGLAMLGFGADLRPSAAGNDEVTFTFL